MHALVQLLLRCGQCLPGVFNIPAAILPDERFKPGDLDDFAGTPLLAGVPVGIVATAALKYTRIAGYKAGPQGVRYPKEEINGDQAIVHTEITSERDLSTMVHYHLLHKDSDWKVYDIIIEGVSLVNNYRTQFNTIMLSVPDMPR